MVDQEQWIYGTGAIQSPPDKRDYPIADLLAQSGVDLEAIVLPASYVVPNRPPILNQGNTPMCVAYSTSSMKSYQDVDDQATAKWWDFDEPTFFRQIGGTIHGAVLRNALERLLHYGYPVVSIGQAATHKISAYYAVPKDITSIKTAIKVFGEIVLATPWYHSWFRPVNGVLPRPDYSVGGHAIVADGWDDSHGLRLRNSWGTAWGLSGDCFIPYSYALHSVWEYWKTVDPAVVAYYTVQSGDTLNGIAVKFGLTLAQLLAFPENAKFRANPSLIHAGDTVRVR